MIRLVTHCTRSWLPRIKPYLRSLSEHSPLDNVLLTVACDAPEEYMADLPGVRAVRVTKVAGSPENTDSLQHGAFLDYVDGGGADVLIYTDGDIVMQRKPSADELRRFEKLPVGAVACSYNSGPDETLAIEGARLFPRRNPAEVFGEMVKSAPCYNIGVIAARRVTWQAIYDCYMTRYADALELFGAQQRQQWLVCWAFAELGLTVEVLPYETHTHGCYTFPEGVLWEGGTLNYKGTPVLFKHHV